MRLDRLLYLLLMLVLTSIAVGLMLFTLLALSATLGSAMSLVEGLLFVLVVLVVIFTMWKMRVH